MPNFRNDKGLLELIDKTRHTDKDAFKHILSMYSNLLHSIIHSCGVPAGEYDDVFQEAQIGLYKAVMLYEEKYSSFSTFAYICVKSSVVSYLRNSYPKGNVPMFSLSDDENDESISSFITPESEFIDKESLELLMARIESLLSPFEREVLSLYLADNSYSDMALLLGKDEKSIDNAIQRIRKKLRSPV